MNFTSRNRLVRRAALGAAFVLAAAAAQASQDLTIAVGTCSPGNLNTLQTDLKLTNGAVRKPGRNPPSRYFCDVPFDDLAAAAPSWNQLHLQTIDRNTAGGNVVARLMRRATASASATEVVRVTAVPSTTLRSTSAKLAAPMNFALYDYFLIVDVTTPEAQVDVFSVRLVTR